MDIRCVFANVSVIQRPSGDLLGATSLRIIRRVATAIRLVKVDLVAGLQMDFVLVDGTLHIYMFACSSCVQ